MTGRDLPKNRSWKIRSGSLESSKDGQRQREKVERECLERSVNVENGKAQVVELEFRISLSKIKINKNEWN